MTWVGIAVAFFVGCGITIFIVQLFDSAFQKYIWEQGYKSAVDDIINHGYYHNYRKKTITRLYRKSDKTIYSEGK